VIGSSGNVDTRTAKYNAAPEIQANKGPMTIFQTDEFAQRDKTAIVGIGATPFFRRGQSLPQTTMEMACKAVLAACEDAGLSPKDIDGFSYYTGGVDTPMLAQCLGIPYVSFTATLTGGGSGCPGAVGMASAAILGGQANVVVTLLSLQQVEYARLGAAMANKAGPYARPSTPEKDFVAPYGAFAPGHFFSILAKRHMHEYGTTREHFAEVAISTRQYAITHPTSIRRTPLTLDEYFSARMISDPLCLFDYTMESDGCVAVITTSASRAQDLQQKPVYIRAAAAGGDARWGRGISWMGMPDYLFATAGGEAVAQQLYSRAGMGPEDIDVAELYDHFSPMVLMQLEDFGFCGRGESGPFVADGNLRPGGKLPVNTHGGNLSNAYIIGMTHIVEAVQQLRGTAANQVAGAETALVTGGPSAIPYSAMILRK
jgi:acetyl-CoA acetyltransferase